MTTTTAPPDLAARVRAALRHCYTAAEIGRAGFRPGVGHDVTDDDGVCLTLCRFKQTDGREQVACIGRYREGCPFAADVARAGCLIYSHTALRNRVADLLGTAVSGVRMRGLIEGFPLFTADVPAWCGGERA